MSVTPQEGRVTILVKALPQPSKTHGETVCCAGVTADGHWRRLFPVRFRHLSGDRAFKRWDWVRFKYTKPSRDTRVESCRVHEESLSVEGSLPKSEQASFLNPLVLPSIDAAIARCLSLALLRPKNTCLRTNERPLPRFRPSGTRSRRQRLKCQCSTKISQLSNRRRSSSGSSSRTIHDTTSKTAIGKLTRCFGTVASVAWPRKKSSIGWTIPLTWITRGKECFSLWATRQRGLMSGNCLESYASTTSYKVRCHCEKLPFRLGAILLTAWRAWQGSDAGRS
jgi:hypothetical protein